MKGPAKEAWVQFKLITKQRGLSILRGMDLIGLTPVSLMMWHDTLFILI